MSNKPPKTRDDYALGLIDKRTGKRPKPGAKGGGYLSMFYNMTQNQEKMAAGDITLDDLIEQAYDKADKQIAKNMAGPDEEPQTLAEADADYREQQEARYREEYDWQDATPNDEALLQMILDLEVQQRVVNREFSRATLNVKDRTSLLGELRNIAKDHAELQKRLGFDRLARENKKASDDPMQEWQRVREDGERKYEALQAEAVSRFAEARTHEELRALAKHTLMLDYAIIDALLQNHNRLFVPSGSSPVVATV